MGKVKQILLARRPEGVPELEDFQLAETEMPVPGEGEFLVAMRVGSVDPAIRGFRLFRVIRIIIMLSRFGMAADRAFGETFTHNLLTRLRQWVVNLIGGAVTIYVLDEVADVLHKGTYTRNVARALEQHTDEIEHAVRETVYADPNLGRLRRLPFFDAIVSTSTQVTQRVIIEFLQNERTDRLVADILHENIEQIRMSVRAREDQRALARRKPHETADTT